MLDSNQKRGTKEISGNESNPVRLLIRSSLILIWNLISAFIGVPVTGSKTNFVSSRVLLGFVKFDSRLSNKGLKSFEFQL